MGKDITPEQVDDLCVKCSISIMATIKDFTKDIEDWTVADHMMLCLRVTEGIHLANITAVDAIINRALAARTPPL